jgi:hypothetical protein
MSAPQWPRHVPPPRCLAALGVGLVVSWCFCRYLAPDLLLALSTSLSFCN